ncbi:CMD domain protein [Microbacterium sp. VKM Ac-2923]|uniref:CMD domain protein n=1 Tax=Microbacterium sp. VKM Ac-2923 TaxID=2929476 RepID=UPI001FB46E26|nr:CMD domain protein [Microbacterium sp. VKM Ac-2923]MCJ1708574.1 CMD domain protein [Microbacterium sp. VKM Ac-2923]
MSTPTADIIDLLAGIRPGDALDTVRSQRPQARENAQRSFEALLEPATPGDFPLAERYAVALFVSRLHGFATATEFYSDLLGDEAAGLIPAVTEAAAAAAATGPFGRYREPGLEAESTEGLRWVADTRVAEGLGIRLSAALAHAHLLVVRPREARPEALHTLVDAGWGPDAIVSLSQLVAFLTFQLRLAWGLRVLGAASVPVGAPGSGTATAARASTPTDAARASIAEGV